MSTKAVNLDKLPPKLPAPPHVSISRGKSLGVPEPPRRSLLRRLTSYRATNRKRFF